MVQYCVKKFRIRYYIWTTLLKEREMQMKGKQYCISTRAPRSARKVKYLSLKTEKWYSIWHKKTFLLKGKTNMMWDKYFNKIYLWIMWLFFFLRKCVRQFPFIIAQHNIYYVIFIKSLKAKQNIQIKKN